MFDDTQKRYDAVKQAIEMLKNAGYTMFDKPFRSLVMELSQLEVALTVC